MGLMKYAKSTSRDALAWMCIVNSGLIHAVQYAMIAVFSIHLQMKLQDTSKVSWVMSWYGGCQLVFYPIVGRMGDIVGKRISTLVCLLFGAVGMYGMGIAEDFSDFMIASTLLGFGSSTVMLCLAMIGEASTGVNLRRNMTRMMTGRGIASIFGPLYSAFASEWMSFTALTNTFATLAAIMWGVTLCVLPDSRKVQMSGMKTHLSVTSYTQFIKRSFKRIPSFWILMAMHVFLFVIFCCQFYLLPVHAAIHQYFDATDYSLMLVSGGLLASCVQLLLSKPLYARFGETAVMGLACLVCGTTTYFTYFYWNSYFTGALLSISYACTLLAVQGLMVTAAQYGLMQDKGQIMGFFQSAAALGRLIGPLALLDNMYEWKQTSPFVMSAVVGILIAVLAPVRKRRRAKDGEYVARGGFAKVRSTAQMFLIANAPRRARSYEVNPEEQKSAEQALEQELQAEGGAEPMQEAPGQVELESGLADLARDL